MHSGYYFIARISSGFNCWERQAIYSNTKTYGWHGSMSATMGFALFVSSEDIGAPKNRNKQTKPYRKKYACMCVSVYVRTCVCVYTCVRVGVSLLAGGSNNITQGIASRSPKLVS